MSEVNQYPDNKTLEDEIRSLNKSIEEQELKLKETEDQPTISEDLINSIKLIIIQVNKETDKRSKLYKNLMGLISEHIDPKTLIVSYQAF